MVDWSKPTALFVGRYQGFHEGHKALILEGLQRVGQACIAVRMMNSGLDNADPKNPFGFNTIFRRIEEVMGAHMEHIIVISIPNITNVFYGRDVDIERIDLPPELQAVSATKVREQMKKNDPELHDLYDVWKEK
jgi:hypothetical protein